MAIKKNKNLEYYRSLPWSYTITQAKEDGQNFFIIRVNELPGVCTDAPTIEEGMRLIKEAIQGAIEIYLENSEEIPEPVDQETYKGNISYRTSSKRHSRIAREASARNASLSAVIDECIDKVLNK